MRRALPLLLLLAAPATAQPLLDLPVACTLGTDCHIQQYMDRDPGPEATDYTCGLLSYDGHKGTDFALPSRAAVTEGVDVRAAAAGRVRGVRDGMPDILQGAPGAPDLAGRDCGNGVVIDHGDGWETQYCHMRQGSLAVAEGQEVAAGDRLGAVGMSGNTQFPHLHLSVRHAGTEVDPFASETVACGDTADATLWRDPPPYVPGGLIAAGFADAVPDYEAVKEGTAAATSLSATGPALVLWGYAYGSRPGDTLRLAFAGPEGPVFDDTMTLDRQQAQLFRAAGRRTPPGGWPRGAYTGTVQHLRNGTLLDSRTATVTLD